MKRAAAILMIGCAVMTAHAWTVSLLDNPAVLAFVLSSNFWPSVVGGIALAIAALTGLVLALVSIPGSPSGRTGPEGGE